MLFDLRGRGRQRAVRVIYLGLALLMGGGLVFFGVGGNVSGGLFDAFKGNGGSSASDQITKQRNKDQKAANANPSNPALWAKLATDEYQLAGQSKGYNPNATTAAGQFTGSARQHLVAARNAWDRHLKLAGDDSKANAETAGIMKNALVALGDNAGAVRAQEIVLASIANPGFGDYAQLAALAYQAGQVRKGDLASQKAVELAPKSQKKDLKSQLDAYKAQASSGATGGASPTAGG